MDPVQTLHEFTLNLLQNEQARSLFAADPTGALQSAGLSGITATDVHEALPLVMDYAPTHIVDSFERSVGSTVDQIAVGSALSSGPQGAIDQLQQITEKFSFIPAGGAPTSALDSVVKSFTDFTAKGDVAHSLDSTVGKVAGNDLGHLGQVGGVVDTAHLGNTDHVTTTVNGVSNSITDQLHHAAGSVGIGDTVGSVTHNLDAVVSTTHVDQTLHSTVGVADHAVQDLNIGNDNHGIGNVDVHVGDVLSHNDITHHAGF